MLFQSREMTKYIPVRLQKKPAKKKGMPAWIKAIPESQAHGSGTYQKRLWRLVSDFVRIRDFHSFQGRCVATGAKIGHWRDGNAGHYKSYSVCNGMFKFDESNIHLQSAQSNAWGGMDIGHNFAEELNRRNKDSVWGIECDNRLYQNTNITTTMVIEKMRDILSKMKDLPEKPEYYARVLLLLEA